MKILLLALIVLVLCGSSLANDCTNNPGELASHTYRYKYLQSINESWRAELEQLPSPHSRKLLINKNNDWETVYSKIKNMEISKPVEGILKEISLHEVRLTEGSMYAQAQKTNLEYLLMLNVDSLLWNFRKTAGLPTPGTPYGGWEEPHVELRGHFVGHYLSASAQMWASTHNKELNDKMSALVDGLSACQQKIGSGYLSAFSVDHFVRFEHFKLVWAPYYTIHKVMAGLLDQHTLAGNPEALKMATWMADYFYQRVQQIIKDGTVEKHYGTINEEVGGMNDVLYRLYSVTGNSSYLMLGHLFDKPCFLGLLALETNNLGDFHANEHIPMVVGSQTRYEVTGDPLPKAIATYFMGLVSSSHSYATGGTSVEEFWREPMRMASALGTENQESCSTYNMLKVARNLYRWTKDVSYADYYERLLVNGVLGIQRGTEPGVMLYMLPQGRGVSKARSEHGWGTKFDSFWCCYGTGIESFSKLGDSIYFEEAAKEPSLFVMQYISSLLKWKSGNFFINQIVAPVSSSDPFLRVTFAVAPTEANCPTTPINFRIPTWTHLAGAKATVNGQYVPLPGPGNYLSIAQIWFPGDKITLELPMTLRLEQIKDDRPEYASLQAILFGPYVLAGHSSGDWDINVGPNKSVLDLITPVPAASYNTHLITLSQQISNSTLVVSNSNLDGSYQSLSMLELPEPGTDDAVHATFRLVLLDQNAKFASLKDAIGKAVQLEPFDVPGMHLMHNEAENSAVIADDSRSPADSVFNVVAGLDGKKSTISLESESKKGCFLYGGSVSGAGVKLSCRPKSNDSAFNEAASFMARNGLSQYHPIIFMVKGTNRGYLLEPLMAFRDESYTVYFNIQP